jgi:2-desacetyl-2-hydroxyethyl bacteriochlorophyllide A dehydrogenase
MKAKAVVFTEKGKIDVRELTLAKLADNEVMIDVEHSAISPGTERWCLTGMFHYGKDCYYKFPLVPGYQHAGYVAAVGKDVKSLKVGDRAFACNSRFEEVPCFNWGGHCSMSVNAEEAVIKLPDNVSFKDAAFLVVAQVGYNGGSRPSVEPGDVAVVIGDGLIGQFVAQTLRARGAYVITAGKGDLERLEYARKYSCDMVIDTAKNDLKKEVAKISPEGVKIVVEAIGIHENTAVAFDLLAWNGHYVLNGFYPLENRVDLNPFSTKEITIHNPAGYTRQRFLRTLEMIGRGKLNVNSLITHTIKWPDTPKAYENLLLNRKEFSMGIAIDWRD